MEIIASIGTATAQGLQTKPRDPTFRLKSMQLLSTSINRIEEYYFGEPVSDEEPKLGLIAGTWAKRAKG